MKCKICGHRTATLNAMRVHYIKKHPDSMRHGVALKRKKHWKDYPAEREGHECIGRFCPHCGLRLES